MITTAFVAASLVLSQVPRRPPAPAQVPVRRQIPPSGAPIGGGEPAAVLNLEKQWAGADALMPLLGSEDRSIRIYALRAIGRLQQPALVPRLIAFASTDPALRPQVALAIAQSLVKFNPMSDPALTDSVFNWLLPLAAAANPTDAAPYLGPLGRIAWMTADQVHQAEHVFDNVMEKTADSLLLGSVYGSAVAGLELLGRHNAKVTRFEDPTVARLATSLANSAPNDDPPGTRLSAFGALLAAGTVDQSTIKTALKDLSFEVRRRAVTILGGTSVPFDDAERATLIQERLGDESPHVRFDAVHAYAARRAPNGCAPLLGLLTDQDSHVVLAALDALGDVCPNDEDVLTRLTADARTPPPSGAWQREAHAFVALAKHSPETAAIAMGAFATHTNWWVRMYAVKAAVVLNDTGRLDRLAYDQNDNVVEAALAPMRRLDVPNWDRALVAALGRSDVQLLHTAAEMVKSMPQDRKLAAPLVDAVLRLTKEGKETSRDARVSLLEAIGKHATAADMRQLEPLLKDFDPVVAGKAAEVISRLTGRTVNAEPMPIVRGWPQEFTDRDTCVAVDLDSGQRFLLRLDPQDAPITVDHFLRLAVKDHYYDGTTIQRVEPNFVIQGGSPGANEYSGHHDYMRDEIGAPNIAGSVGLSTRGGLNTADAQFFVNLVNNNRLDYLFTVFAHVGNMDVIDTIEEGTTIKTMTLIPGTPSSCGSEP
jgi:cyclophilin family peptidyl-prolyl cis-trans isomerase/HEAT repeat protein